MTVSYPRPDECGVLVGRFISTGKELLLLAATLAPETLCPELFGDVTDCEVDLIWKSILSEKLSYYYIQTFIAGYLKTIFNII